MITLEQFKNFILEIRKEENRAELLVDAIEIWAPDSYVIPPSNTIALSILEAAFNDKNEWISYWIYELEWGKKWNPGMIIGEDGRDIKLRSIEDLYNLLIENMRENG